MTDDERRGLDRLLTHHTKRLALLIELLGGSGRVVGERGDTGGEPIPHGGHAQDLARGLYRESRNELRRDYDVLERRTWSKAEAIVATALYDGYVALSGGSVMWPQTMLGEATRARGVLDEAILECQQREAQ